MPNPVVHFEILGPDGEQLQRFYAEMFGWTINADNPMSYGLVDTGGGGINGGIGQSEQPLAAIYIEVDDPAQYLEKVVAAGAELVQDVTEIPDMVTFAQFRDPAGNIVGLVKGD
ncbi:MAG: VOC family protein [Gammaproteobacteria bacterium]|nr:VOC family protein [Gammaproteobacteria bacterium]